MSEREDVTITRAPMSLAQLVHVAHGARVILSDDAIEHIEASRRVVNDALGREDLVYGLNTGLGHARDQRLPAEALVALQPVIVAMHDGSMGDPFPTPVVRAAMAARLNGIARGGSGATLGVAKALESLLNAGVHPLVPETASVGAADLGHMAAIGMVALGGGRAEYQGEQMDGSDALRAAGIPPLTLAPKDGLALVSANGVTIGFGSLVALKAERLLAAADRVAAVSLEALGANPSIVDPVVASAKSSPGQVETSRRVRAALANGDLFDLDIARSVQDPLAFRVIPQVHGAGRDVLAFATSALTDELNARSDNPLASIDEGRLISNGNFHPMLVALSIDSLRPALAHVGQLSERRLNHLWDGLVGSFPDVDLTDLTLESPAMAGLALRYAAAARSTRLRQLANPVTLDVPPLDFGVEDHATNAPEAAHRTDESLDVLLDVLTVELLVANVTLESTEPKPRLGAGTGPVVAALSELLGRIPAGSSTADVHGRVRGFLADDPVFR